LVLQVKVLLMSVNSILLLKNVQYMDMYPKPHAPPPY
jgi:hypothetical protein